MMREVHVQPWNKFANCLVLIKSRSGNSRKSSHFKTYRHTDDCGLLINTHQEVASMQQITSSSWFGQTAFPTRLLNNETLAGYHCLLKLVIDKKNVTSITHISKSNLACAKVFEMSRFEHFETSNDWGKLFWENVDSHKDEKLINY